jgi:hypothetical protein
VTSSDLPTGWKTAIAGWLAPYLGRHLPGFDPGQLIWAVTGDVVFVASFFVLGGEFWDKLRSLFVHGARAVFPNSEKGDGKSPQ